MQSNSARLRFRVLAFLLLCWALLLAAPAARADGLIVITTPTPSPDHFAFAPLQVTFHHVTVNIQDRVAVTSVDEEFHNPGNAVLEGTYIFPLPAGAHVEQFTMDINGKPTDAELLDAAKARQLYEETVRKYRDPALLEYTGRGALRVRIFPIEANGSKHIQLRYTQALSSDSGLFEYSYPLNTEKFSSQLLQDVSVTVHLSCKDPIKSIYSPSHSVAITRDGTQSADAKYQESNARPDTDFKLIFSTSSSDVGANLLTSRVGDEDGYFMLLASPGFDTRQKAQPKDICFVLDTSGSMADANKIDQAKRALAFCLANLNADDRFQIIRFSSETEPLFDSLVAADEPHLKTAREFVAGLKPIGGTALNEALLKAMSLPHTADRPFNVVFLTDGMPTVGDTNDDHIVASAKSLNNGARVFCFGIGSDVNTHLLDGIAAQTRATSSYVTGNEDIELKISSFFTKIREPVLTNVSVAFSGDGIRTSSVYPNEMPDLFKGESLTIFGRYAGAGPGVVKITGMVNGQAREYRFDIKFAQQDLEHAFVAQLWATRRVGWLLDEIRLHGESAELKDEVVALARRYGIVTPYTAYLIMEDETRRGVPLASKSMSEMESDRRVRANAATYYRSNGEEAQDTLKQTGTQAVTNARAMQQLKAADNTTEAAVAAAPAALDKAPAGPAATASGGQTNGYKNTTNYTQQARVVNGRAFYQNSGIWTDSAIQSAKNLKQNQVKLGSDEYFKLLSDHPDIAPYLALGDRVNLLLADTEICIR